MSRPRWLLAAAAVAVAVAPVAARTASAAVTVYVNRSSGSCSDAGPGTVSQPYCSISAALAAHHAPGDSVLVYPGIYREQVTVPGSGQSGLPVTLAGRGSPGSPVVISGADDFSNPAMWVQYAGNVWRAAGVTWNPRQVLADSARLAVSTSAPADLPPGSFVWQSGLGLFVNVGDGDPATHHAEIGRRSYGVLVSGIQWVSIDGLAVTRAEDTGIEVTGSTSYVSATSDSVTFSYRYGIQVAGSGATQVLIVSCVASNNLLSGIALTSGAGGCTVQDNASYQNLTPSSSAGIYLYAASGSLIQRNLLHDNAYSGLHIQSSAGIVSLQNRSWDNGAHGFHDLGSSSIEHGGDVAFGNFVHGFDLDGGTSGATLGNCIATVNGLIGQGYDLMVDSVATTGLNSDYNLFWNPSGRPPVHYAGANYASLAAFAAATGHDTRSIQSDPRFADPRNGDLRLTDGSPAIDNANSSLPFWSATDAVGGSRIDDPFVANAGLGPVPYADRGALEYVPTGGGPGASVPQFQHVIVVMLENESYVDAMAAPYIGSVAAANARSAEFYAITHPSQPNYFALWSGDTQGIVSDTCPPPGSPYATENLGHACEAAGIQWRAYAEDLPAVGSTVCDAGLYARRHCPWTGFSNLNHNNERPYTQLAADIASSSLPRLAFVIPNNCHNEHDCPIDSADVWLSHELPPMISAVGPNGLVVLTYDEDDDAAGNNILTVFAGPLVRPGFISHRFVNHYTLLRTICDGLGLAPFGAAAAETPITDVWTQTTDAVGPPPGGSTGVVMVGAGRPNPFRTATSVPLTLSAPTRVAAEVYDLAGRRVWTLPAATLSGATQIRWDGTRDDGGRTRPGVYLMRVRAGSAAFTRRVVRLE
jgi:parallel beta-helix repeat protein